jgi:hypothetical protein
MATLKKLDPPMEPATLVRRWNELKAQAKLVEKEIDKLKPQLKAALGESDDVGVKLNEVAGGVYVIHRVRQDRRKPDLRFLTGIAALVPGGALALTQPGITETVLTETGAATLLESGILDAAALQSSLTGALVEYAEVRFREDGTDVEG